jgi:hypothetical protein
MSARSVSPIHNEAYEVHDFYKVDHRQTLRKCSNCGCVRHKVVVKNPVTGRKTTRLRYTPEGGLPTMEVPLCKRKFRRT